MNVIYLQLDSSSSAGCFLAFLVFQARRAASDLDFLRKSRNIPGLWWWLVLSWWELPIPPGTAPSPTGPPVYMKIHLFRIPSSGHGIWYMTGIYQPLTEPGARGPDPNRRGTVGNRQTYNVVGFRESYDIVYDMHFMEHTISYVWPTMSYVAPMMLANVRCSMFNVVCNIVRTISYVQC